MKAIIEFIEMIKKERDTAHRIFHGEENCLSDRFVWENRFDALNDIIESPECYALKALSEQKIVVTDAMVELAEDVYLYSGNNEIKDDLREALEAVFDMVNKESADKPTPKQTLLEFMDKRAGYVGQALTKDDFMRREVYKNITDWYKENK